MANIGMTTAFYKVETSLTRANTEVSKSMSVLRLVSKCECWRPVILCGHGGYLPFGLCRYKAGIKGASVVMGYLRQVASFGLSLRCSKITRACCFR